MIRGHHLDTVVEHELAPSVRWLQRQIRAGRVTARKLGRHWVMTDDDIADMLEKFKNRTTTVTDIRPTGGLSAASMRRRAS